MKQKIITRNNASIILGIIIGIFVLFTLSVLIWGHFDDEKRDDYCLRIYPSKINEPSIFTNSWSESNKVESGYIRCCRRYYENHESQQECKIFKYND